VSALPNADAAGARHKADVRLPRPQFRLARPRDAEAVAALHADSWRRHYRGAYADAFLDGEVLADRRAVWSERLAQADPRRCTILAQQDGLAGFAHVVFEQDPSWGALLDNMHVAYGHKRRGIGSSLLALTARAVLERPRSEGLYLWVLEQNLDAQAFYEACGASLVGRARVSPPGGVAGRLTGSPAKLRYAWRRAAMDRLAATRT
jgi:GNAT superfamily N-acetyltransferase